MKRKPLPSQDTLNKLLSYAPETGILSFKPRNVKIACLLGVGCRTLSTWNSRYAGTSISNKIGAGYICATISGEKYPAHRIIWKMVYGEDPSTIDHIDGDRANNRIANLRNVTELDNQRNRKLNANNSSGVSGVRWVAERKRWISRICLRGRQKVLGSFLTLEEAVKARRSAEAELGYHENHGRSARKVGA